LEVDSVGQRLTTIAKRFRTLSPYRGDDGRVYVG
jgi:hypothetical protein